MFTNQIYNAPATIAQLNLFECHRCHLRASETAAEQNCENGTIAQSFYRTGIRRTEKRLGLPKRQPVTHADSFRLRAP